MLQIILEVKIVEALPELLRIEDELAARLKEAGGTLPAFELDSPLVYETNSYGHAYALRLYTAQVYQSELLAVMAALLRGEHFDLLLQSKIEAYYLAWQKREAERADVASLRENLAREQPQWIKLEPPSGASWPENQCRIPNTPAVRNEIRQLVKDYLQHAPKAQSNSSGLSQGK